MANELQRLQEWYASQCNGDWEHTYGVTIDNLDNPGWWVKIELADTDLQDAIFSPIKDLRSEADWVECNIELLVWHGYGGVGNLTEILNVFLTWAESHGERDA
jgi:Immunity protein 53